MISGDKGLIVLGNWFFCSCEATLYDRNAKELEKVNSPNIVNGYEYEIDEVHRCLSMGLSESRIVPHESTVAVMKIMDKCRNDWCMKYPNE